MEHSYPKFTKEMKKTYTILVPNMAVMQFAILKAVMEHEGYKVEVLGNCGSEVAQLGLKYVPVSYTQLDVYKRQPLTDKTGLQAFLTQPLPLERLHRAGGPLKMHSCLRVLT